MDNRRLLNGLYVVFIFLVGFLFSQFWILYVSGSGYDLINGFDVKAPPDNISSEEILVYSNRVVINVEGARISSYAPTGSMVPVLDNGANGISVKPGSEEDIEVGDIISFRSGEDIIVHRVIEKGEDDEGIYFITKGDSSPIADGKIRFSDIEHVLIGLIY